MINQKYFFFKGKNSLELELDLLCLVLSKYIFNILIGHRRSEEESEGLG
jgi:hypothetical protein